MNLLTDKAMKRTQSEKHTCKKISPKMNNVHFFSCFFHSIVGQQKKEKKMKTKMILTAVLGASNLAFANDIAIQENCAPPPCIHSSYNYGGVGLGPLPLPALTLALGRRSVVNARAAVDTGVNVATLLRWNLVRGYVNGLCYLNQTPCSQYYCGLGASTGIPIGYDDIRKAGFFVAPNILFGKEFYNANGCKRFLQAEVLYPAYVFSEKVLVNFPFITLKYGLAF